MKKSMWGKSSGVEWFGRTDQETALLSRGTLPWTQSAMWKSPQTFRVPNLVTSLIAYPPFSLQKGVCSCPLLHRTFRTSGFLSFQQCIQYLVVTENVHLICIAVGLTAEEGVLRGVWQNLVFDSDATCADLGECFFVHRHCSGFWIEEFEFFFKEFPSKMSCPQIIAFTWKV